MQSLSVQDVRGFMSQLLTSEVFDTFLVTEASITTFATFTVDGTYNADYFDEEDESSSSSEYVRWKLVRPHFYNLIKGQRRPERFRIVFRLADYNTEKLLASSGLGLTAADVAGLYLNINYSDNAVSCVTGSALRVFSLDKSLDHVWDDMICKLFRKQQIPFEIQ